MTSTTERKHLTELINEATSSGSRIKPACAEAGIGFNTWQRWNKAGEFQRPHAERPRPSNALTREERDEIIKRCNEPAFASKPPSQIVPSLLDDGIWIASVSSLYRVLKQAGQLNNRGRQSAPRRHAKPTTHIATAPNQCWCWDVTWMPLRVKGQFYYLYTYIDIFSRKIVGWDRVCLCIGAFDTVLEL